MMDGKGLLDQVLKAASNMGQSPASGTNGAGSSGLDPLLQGLLGGIGGGMLGSLLSGKGSNSLAKLGGGAALATLAYRAYQNYSANTGKSGNLMDTVKGLMNGLSQPEQFAQDDAAGTRSQAMLLAVINAAKADGVLDDQERAAIQAQVQQNTNDPNALAWVEQELSKPINVQALAALATNPQIATEIYVASLAACNGGGTNAQEQAYLNQLQQALGIDDALKQSIEQTLQAA
ncbi:MAG: tellurite resistance TerB family protein [Neisseriaceae bacterium]|nr:tellurite resistance TerB family protein [Neisseriaceae bacterium]